MRPNARAQESASYALALAPPSPDADRFIVRLASAIATGEQLSASQVERLARVHAGAAPTIEQREAKTDAWRSHELMGGDAMRRQLAERDDTTPAPIVQGPARASSILDAHVANQIHDGVPLTAAAIPDGLARVADTRWGMLWQCDTADAAWMLLEAADGWRGLGRKPDGTADVDVATAVDRAADNPGVPLQVATSGGEHDLAGLVAIERIRRDAATPPQRIEAAATVQATAGYAALNAEVAATVETLKELTAGVRVALQATANTIYRTTMGRIGALKQAEDPSAPTIVHAAATANVELRPGKADKQIVPAVNDAADQARDLLTGAVAAARTTIENAFGVRIEDRPPSVDPAVAYYRAALTDYLTRRAAGSAPLAADATDDDLRADLVVPAYIVAGTVALAAGAAVGADGGPVRDSAGRARSADVTGDDCFGCGPDGLAMIDDAITALLEPGSLPPQDLEVVQARATRRPGALISDELRSDLAELAAALEDRDLPSVGELRVVRSEWVLGEPVSGVHFRPHEHDGAGTVVITQGNTIEPVDDVLPTNSEPWPDGAVYSPGDHPHCYCVWDSEVFYATPEEAAELV